MSEFYNLNPDPKNNPIFNQLTETSKVVGARTIVADKETGIESNLTSCRRFSIIFRSRWWRITK